jgi:hypothetical protein
MIPELYQLRFFIGSGLLQRFTRFHNLSDKFNVVGLIRIRDIDPLALEDVLYSAQGCYKGVVCRVHQRRQVTRCICPVLY